MFNEARCSCSEINETNGCLQWVNQFRYALTYHIFIIQFKLQYCHNFLFNSIRCYFKKKMIRVRDRETRGEPMVEVFCSLIMYSLCIPIGLGWILTESSKQFSLKPKVFPQEISGADHLVYLDIQVSQRTKV